MIRTSRIWYAGDDRLDITRGTGGSLGLVFAPSRVLLDWYKNTRRSLVMDHSLEKLDAAWKRYVECYQSEMRISYRTRRDRWERVLRMDRVVLCCYCPTADRCHRGLLADIFVKLGAVYQGEMEGES